MPHNWLLFAIGGAGGVGVVARKLKVSTKTIRRWWTLGIDDVPFGKIVKLAQLSRQPMLGGTLEKCVGASYRRAMAEVARIDKKIEKHDAAVEKQRRKAS
jgi:hypothetical protein